MQPLFWLSQRQIYFRDVLSPSRMPLRKLRALHSPPSFPCSTDHALSSTSALHRPAGSSLNPPRGDCSRADAVIECWEMLLQLACEEPATIAEIQFRKTENIWRLYSSHRRGHRRDIPCLVDATDVRTVATHRAWSVSEMDLSTVTPGAKHERRELHRSVISCRQSTTSPIVMKDVCGRDR